MPYDLALSTKVGIDFFQGKNLEKSFDFAIPLAITFGYEGFQNWSLYSEVGQRTFRPFENSFYGSIGALAKYGMIKNKTEMFNYIYVGKNNRFMEKFKEFIYMEEGIRV